MRRWFLTVLLIGGCSKHAVDVKTIAPLESPSKKYLAVREIDVPGAFVIVRILEADTSKTAGPIFSIGDVTKFMWLGNKDILVYSVSAAYGKAGLYYYDAVTRKGDFIVRPKNIDKKSGMANDWFRIIDITKNQVHYQYSDDVDSATYFEQIKLTRTAKFPVFK